MLKHDSRRDRSPDTRRPQQGRHAARLGARARGDRADCRPSAAPLARRRRGHRARPRRRRGADLGARHADLSRAGRAQPPLCALGARPEARQGSNSLPADAEPAGLYGDLARHHRGRRRRVAHQHAIARAGSCALHRRRGADPRDRRRRMHRAVPLGATFQPAENLVARRPRLFAHRSRDRAACHRAADKSASVARRRSPTAR